MRNFSVNVHTDEVTAHYDSSSSGWLTIGLGSISRVTVHTDRETARKVAYQILDSLDEWDEATVDAGYAHDV